MVIASENVVEMCAIKNKSCVMLHHTHDVTQGISSDVAKSENMNLEALTQE